MALIDGLQKHLIEGHAKACADALRMRGRSVMVLVLVADAHGEIADGLMASAWDSLSPGVAQGFGQMLGRAGYTLESAARTNDPNVLKGGTGSLV